MASDLISKAGLMWAIRSDKCKIFDGKVYIPEDELNIACNKAMQYGEDDLEWLAKQKTCPGCHSEGRVVKEVFDDGDVWYRPECSRCRIGFQENYPSVKEAVEAWNACFHETLT